MANHSPGPWSWTTRSRLRSEAGHTVMKIGVDDLGASEPTGADARLIASAPEMLELLRDELMAWGSQCMFQGECDNPEVWARARAAAGLPQTTPKRCFTCRINALLQRIDGGG